MQFNERRDRLAASAEHASVARTTAYLSGELLGLEPDLPAAQLYEAFIVALNKVYGRAISISSPQVPG